jgi:hypothetical protein
MLKQTVLIALLFILQSCTQQKFSITPINAEANKDLLNAQGLDTRLFSTKDIFQYYEIDGYKNIPKHDLLDKIQEFAVERQPVKGSESWETLTVLFYRESIFSNYSNKVYEAARENESGRILDSNDDVVAVFHLSRVKAKPLQYLRRVILYDDGNILMEKTDSILVK